MLNYEIKVFPKKDENEKTYWTALFPQIKGCVGGGDTPEEAIKAAEENLEVYIEFLQEAGSVLPEEYKEPQYSGKIALRTTKKNHQRLAEISSREGMSVNTILNMAIEQYLTSYSSKDSSSGAVVDKNHIPTTLMNETEIEKSSVIQYDYQVNAETFDLKSKIIQFPPISGLEIPKEN